MNQLSYDFVRHHTSSFTEFVDQASPHLLPQPEQATPSSRDLSPEATTIVAATMADGVMIAGDRRATMGSMIAQRDIEKVLA
jgi:proteasome beta subunit